jgi:hypothetical protein
MITIQNKTVKLTYWAVKSASVAQGRCPNASQSEMALCPCLWCPFGLMAILGVDMSALISSGGGVPLLRNVFKDPNLEEVF